LGLDFAQASYIPRRENDGESGLCFAFRGLPAETFYGSMSSKALAEFLSPKKEGRLAPPL
jgi:hypothetical protein